MTHPVVQDSFSALKADIKIIIKRHGALRHQPLIRSHFWRRFMELTGRDPFAAKPTR